MFLFLENILFYSGIIFLIYSMLKRSKKFFSISMFMIISSFFINVPANYKDLTEGYNSVVLSSNINNISNNIHTIPDTAKTIKPAFKFTCTLF